MKPSTEIIEAVEQLYICAKARECSSVGCNHQTPHTEQHECTIIMCDLHAKCCIPYVPEPKPLTMDEKIDQIIVEAHDSSKHCVDMNHIYRRIFMAGFEQGRLTAWDAQKPIQIGKWMKEEAKYQPEGE